MAELLCKALSGPIPGDDQERHFEVGKSYHFEEETCAQVMRGSPGAFEIVQGLVRLGGPEQLVNYDEPIAEADAALGAGDSNGLTPEPPVEVDEEAEAEARRLQQIAADNARADAEQAEIDRQNEEKARSSNAAVAVETSDDDEEGEAVNLDEMNMTALRAFAKERGFKIRASGVTRDALKQSIQQAIDDEEGD